MKSPKCVSSLSPTGLWSEIGCWAILSTARTRSTGQVHLLGHLFRRRLAAELLDELLLDAHQLVDRLDHVDRDADGPRLVGDGAGDGLPDPPRGVRAELVAAPVLELLDGLHQAHVAFLDQVQERQAAVRVLLGDADDQPQVGLDHLGLGAQALAQPGLQILVAVLEFLARHALIFFHLPELLLLVAQRLGLGLALAGLLELPDRVRAGLEAVVALVRDVHEILDGLLLEVELLERVGEPVAGFRDRLQLALAGGLAEPAPVRGDEPLLRGGPQA